MRAQAINEVANELVEEWQQKAEALVNEIMGWMRDHLDERNAITAAKIGLPQQTVAMVDWLARWKDQKRRALDVIRSSKAVDEARCWVRFTCEHGPDKVDRARKPELLVLLAGLEDTRRKFMRDDPLTHSIWEEVLREGIVEDAAKLPPPPTPEKSPLDELRSEADTPSRLANEARHSTDFRSVYWFGKPYSFTPKQAACVKVLWKTWENRTPEMGQATVLAQAEDELSQANLGERLTDGARLVDVFKTSEAWQTMIVSGATKGTVRLQEPG